MKEVDSMKRNRRILSLLLAICLVAALIPAVSAAQDVVPAEYAQDDQIVNYADHDWILLDSNAEEIVLLLQTPEAPIAYNASGLSNAWAGSNAEVWCETFKDENDIPFEVTFLSHNEVVTYWANNSAANLKTENGWWLRYDGESVDGELFGIAVSDAGFVGFPHVAANYGARPAVTIPVSAIAAMVLENTEWTIKLIDENAYNFAADMSFEPSSKKVTVTYTGAAENSSVYVVVYDQLGKIVTTAVSEAAAANGSVEVVLSEELVGRYTVRIFNSLGDTASAVVEKEFSIADALGNVTEWNINLGGNISANFNLVLDKDVEDDPNAKVAVTVNGNTTQALVDDLPEGKTTDNTACRVVSVSVCAPQMSDEISIQVISNDVYGGEQKFSIRQYAKAIIDGDFNDSTKDLVKHMLNYGAKAQLYFGYNTSNLATDGVDIGGLTFVDVPDNADNYKPSVTEVDGIELYGTSLVLNSNTTLRFYFVLNGDKAITDYGFDGLDVYQRTVSGTEMYFADIKNIAPDELNKPQTVSIDGNVFVSHNPIAYIIRMYHNESAAAGMHDLMYALYNYHTVAANYGN